MKTADPIPWTWRGDPSSFTILPVVANDWQSAWTNDSLTEQNLARVCFMPVLSSRLPAEQDGVSEPEATVAVFDEKL